MGLRSRDRQDRQDRQRQGRIGRVELALDLLGANR